MRRRQFLGGMVAAATSPVPTLAQRTEKVRRIGVLLPAATDDLEFRTRLGAFLQELGVLGWTIGADVQIDTRWAKDAGEVRRHAAELAALVPDIIVASGGSTVREVMQATRSVPIVFPSAVDPVGAGLVDTLARPGGNITGFMAREYSLSGKWLELLKEIAPNVTRVGVLRNPTVSSGPAQFGVIQATAPSLKVEVNALNLDETAEMERAVTSFARFSDAGLIVTATNSAQRHRDLIVTLAARHKLPTVYSERNFVAAGGLISYGPDYMDQYRRAAGYVNRILKGDKPADLPVLAPAKYQLVINRPTAKVLGLPLPESLLARADEVIE